MKTGLLAVCLLCVGCGDVRDGFVGEYEGKASSTFVFSDTGQSLSDSWTALVSVDRSAKRPDAVVLWGTCDLLGVVQSDQRFTLEPRPCPSSSVSIDGVPCTFTETVETGTAELGGNGASLQVTYSGTDTWSNCSDASYNASGTYTTHMALTRKVEPSST